MLFYCYIYLNVQTRRDVVFLNQNLILAEVNEIYMTYFVPKACFLLNTNDKKAIF